jgi:membrane protein implicated in regulation of membrane protease activity
MSGWLWCIIGLGLLVAELVIPAGFFLFFLGASALIIAFLTSIGLMPFWYWPLWAWQTLIFSIVSVALLFVFPKKLQGLFGRASAPMTGNTVGSIVKLAGNLAPGATGSAELWGTAWRVKNVDSKILEEGSEAVVVGSEGITLQIKSNN